MHRVLLMVMLLDDDPALTLAALVLTPLPWLREECMLLSIGFELGMGHLGEV